MPVHAKKTAPLCALILALFLFAGCAPAAARTEIEISPAAPVSYSAEAVERAEALAVDAAEEIFSEVLGTAFDARRKELVRAAAAQFVQACGARGIPEAQFSAAAELLGGQGELYLALAREGLSEGTFARLSALFGQLCGVLGAERAGLVCFDAALALCEHRAATYEQRCEETGLSYYMRYAEEERALRASLVADTGEENFSRLVRMALSGSHAAAAGEGLLSAEEAALVLRAEGDLLARVQMSAAGWEALFSLACSFGGRLADALDGTHSVAAFAANAQALSGALARALSAAQGEDAAADDLLFALSLLWTDAEWAALDAFVRSPLDEEAFASYFKGQGMTTAYAAYLGGEQRATLEQLRAADAENFAETFRAYLNAASPRIAFLVYGL